MRVSKGPFSLLWITDYCCNEGPIGSCKFSEYQRTSQNQKLGEEFSFDSSIALQIFPLLKVPFYFPQERAKMSRLQKEIPIFWLTSCQNHCGIIAFLEQDFFLYVNIHSNWNRNNQIISNQLFGWNAMVRDSSKAQHRKYPKVNSIWLLSNLVNWNFFWVIFAGW